MLPVPFRCASFIAQLLGLIDGYDDRNRLARIAESGGCKLPQFDDVVCQGIAIG